MKTLLAAPAVLALAVALSPAAHADAYDYIRMLDNNNVRYVSADGAIEEGTMACSRIRHGEPAANQQSHMIGYSFRDSNMMTLAAAWTLCPDQKHNLEVALAHGLKVN